MKELILLLFYLITIVYAGNAVGFFNFDESSLILLIILSVVYGVHLGIFFISKRYTILNTHEYFKLLMEANRNPCGGRIFSTEKGGDTHDNKTN